MTHCPKCGSDDLVVRGRDGAREYLRCVTCEATGFSDGSCWASGRTNEAYRRAVTNVRDAFDE